MNRSSKLALLFLLFLLAWEIAPGEAAAQRPDQGPENRYRTVTVMGEGTAKAVPDMATVRFGVVTRDDDPEVARRDNAAAARRAMNVVRSLIDDEQKLQLESVRLQPAREYDPETRRYIELGFEAVRDIVVEVNDLEVLPTLVARIVQEGANRLHNVTYELKNQDAVRNEALQQAVLNAREKATVMVETLGANMGGVLRISEGGGGGPVPLMRDAAFESMAAAKVAEPEPEAYAPGEIEVRVMVEVVFALLSGSRP